MAFPPVPFQEWFLRQTSAGNAALNAYVARVKADGGVVEAIGCVPLAVWDWAAPVAPTLLLDLFPNAAAAYSLRKLRTAYSGSALRVRKEVSSVDEETDIGFNASNELDTAALLSFASDADGGNVTVSTWYDQSGNNNHATNINESEQPKIVSSGSVETLGSEVTPVRQGVTTTLDVSGIESSVTGAFTIATRFYLSSQSDSDCIFGGRGLTAGAGLCASYLSGAWRFEVITTIGTRAIVSVSDTNTPINNWHNVIFTWDGTTNSNAIKVYLNTSSNVFSATANGTVINYDASYPMSIFNADRNSFDGGLATWDIWNSQITDIDGLFTAITP